MKALAAATTISVQRRGSYSVGEYGGIVSNVEVEPNEQVAEEHLDKLQIVYWICQLGYFQGLNKDDVVQILDSSKNIITDTASLLVY